MKKKDIQEIIDSDNNVIGANDTPESGPEKESEASKTTDYNARVHGQNFKNDFLGRFGFYFYESEGSNMPPVIKSLTEAIGPKKAMKVMEVIKPHLEKTLEEVGDPLMNESKIIEDKLKLKKDKDKSLSDAKDNASKGINDKKMDKIANLLAHLPKNQIDSLIQLLEAKRK